jgi:hypothetical protein
MINAKEAKMNERAKGLTERFTAFNNDMISFVESCSEEDWKKVTEGEQWPVCVVARHVAAGHYRAVTLTKMIIAGEELPDLTAEAIDQMNAKHASENVDCTRSEVLELLRDNGSSIAGYVSELSDVELDRTGHLTLIGGEISTQQFIENVIIQSGSEHLANMKAATGK